MKKQDKHVEIYYSDLYDIVFNKLRRTEVRSELEPGTVITFGANASYGRWDDYDNRYLVTKTFVSYGKIFIEFKKAGKRKNAN